MYEMSRTICANREPDMPKAATSPTAGELEILSVLWRRGPSTVREVHFELGERTGYTSVLKLMQIMAAKGLVQRDRRLRTHVYRPAPASAETRTQRRLVGELIDRAFGGSAQ